ncbi:hypothetical protein HPP92_000296 [Vanilla planifolia]|uniref:G-patch domain-containing protein n=1 Tax=Vanilla planifolia TaxID=51239 RepID=A0A835RNJ9_VANPL|nr:hypothetical protein HPP92_000296 [Vanilla planifolia]
MAERENEGSETATTMDSNGVFVWDEESKLYYHASSGFYHEPFAGWYYSCRDGLYYTFESGAYVPIICNKEEKAAASQSTSSSLTRASCVDSCFSASLSSNEIDSKQPPSEWIEETLINLYLSGYSNVTVDHDILPSHQINELECQVLCNKEIDLLSSDDQIGGTSAISGEQNDECTPECVQEMDALNEMTSSREEESWQAQYGQVIQVATEDFPPIAAIDLWDWHMTVENVKNKQVAKLIGRLAGRSRRVYRLKSPSSTYLASVSTYDSSNPTKDWKFPNIFSSNKYNGPVHCEANILGEDCHASSSTKFDESSNMTNKKSTSIYRDRAAERRVLHGGFSRGPGQKYFLDDTCFAGASQAHGIDETVHEAANTSFGPGSYARKILEGLGWKLGESLGSSNKGILEPICPVGNIGYTGLG